MHKSLRSVLLAASAALGLFLYFFSLPLSTALRSSLGTVLVATAACLFRLGRPPASKRVMRCAGVLGALFSLFATLGRELHLRQSLCAAFAAPDSLVLLLLRLMGLWAFFALALEALLSAGLRAAPGSPNALCREPSGFFILWALIFLCWLPVFLLYAPGIITYDSVSELNHILPMADVNNHHPFAHQMLIRKLVLWGKALFGTYHAGVCLYTLTQMLFMSGVFSYALRFLARIRAGAALRGALFCFYALHAVNSLYSLMMLKDVWFSGFTLLALLLLEEEAGAVEAAFSSWARWLRFMVLCGVLLCFCIFRNNGYYAFVLAFPFFLLANRVHWKRLLALGAAVMLLNVGYNAYLYDYLQIGKSSSQEMLSLPLQQLARTAREHPGELSGDDVDILRECIPDLEGLGQRYDPSWADPVKNSGLYDHDQFLTDPLRYAGAWARLFFRFPGSYLDAFAAQNLGYWYPDELCLTEPLRIEENGYELALNPALSGLQQTVAKLLEALKEIPLLASLMSPGFMVWLALFSAALLLLKGRGRLASPLLLLLGLWLTNLASPVACEFRYLYGVTLSAPLCLGVALAAKSVPQNSKEEAFQ